MSKENMEVHARIHGPTQRYYYLKMKQAERFAKKIIAANPYKADDKIWQELWSDAQTFLKPKPSAGSYLEIKELDKKSDV